MGYGLWIQKHCKQAWETQKCMGSYSSLNNKNSYKPLTHKHPHLSKLYPSFSFFITIHKPILCEFHTEYSIPCTVCAPSDIAACLFRLSLVQTLGPGQHLLHSRTLPSIAAQLNLLSHIPHGISLTLQAFLFRRDKVRIMWNILFSHLADCSGT